MILDGMSIVCMSLGESLDCLSIVCMRFKSLRSKYGRDV